MNIQKYAHGLPHPYKDFRLRAEEAWLARLSRFRGTVCQCSGP